MEELGDELLVYDTQTDRGHSLSPAAAKVWRRCDGRTPVEGLVAQLELDEATVDRGLDELAAAGLLEASSGSTRRELTVRLAKVGGAVAAAPLIVSVTAPTPAQAQTLAFCRTFAGQGCGKCSQQGCCCCEPADGSIKDCVPDTATCCALYGSTAVTSSGCTGDCGPAPRLDPNRDAREAGQTPSGSSQTASPTADPGVDPAIEAAPSTPTTPATPDNPTPSSPPATPTTPAPNVEAAPAPVEPAAPAVDPATTTTTTPAP